MADANKKLLYKYGSKGAEVGKIQEALGELYTNEGGVVDNDYGWRTRKAVRNFQNMWNADPTHKDDQLVPDGKVGEFTYPRLMQWYQSRQQQQQQQPQEQPQQAVEEQPEPTVTSQPTDGSGTIDTSNAIGSLAELLGPTPAEREAQQAKLERSRSQMAMWTGLFDGLRHLGNLYYTAKGARPQQFNDPYKLIDENYQRQKKTLDDMAAYRHAYGKQLYALQRQGAEDKRKDMLAQAQANWYNGRESIAQQRADSYIRLNDGKLAKVNAETGRIEALTPLEEKKMIALTNKYNRGGGSGGAGNKNTYGYRTITYFDENGNKVVERIPTTNNQPAGQEQPTTRVTAVKGNGTQTSNIDNSKLSTYSIHSKK